MGEKCIQLCRIAGGKWAGSSEFPNTGFFITIIFCSNWLSFLFVYFLSEENTKLFFFQRPWIKQKSSHWKEGGGGRVNTLSPCISFRAFRAENFLGHRFLFAPFCTQRKGPHPDSTRGSSEPALHSHQGFQTLRSSEPENTNTEEAPQPCTAFVCCPHSSRSMRCNSGPGITLKGTSKEEQKGFAAALIQGKLTALQKVWIISNCFSGGYFLSPTPP